MSVCIRLCVVQRVLRDAALTAKYDKTVKGVFCPEHDRAQQRRSLKLLLSLVLFLDRAKQTDVLQLGVCPLFDPSGDVKSSREVVCRIAEHMLAGEGDVTRHLSSMGYCVHFEQHALHEFDFTVKDLFTDLRDGVRLARAFEIAANKQPLTYCKVRDWRESGAGVWRTWANGAISTCCCLPVRTLTKQLHDTAPPPQPCTPCPLTLFSCDVLVCRHCGSPWTAC